MGRRRASTRVLEPAADNRVASHGEKGDGKPNDRLVGGSDTLKSDKPTIKTVGSYWPYATTVLDYVRRAMPFDAPKSLRDEEVYAVTAYPLHLNGVIAEDGTIDAASLPKIEMPNRNGVTPRVAGRWAETKRSMRVTWSIQ